MVKKGFSLAEDLIVMAVISIFFAAAARIITTKPKTQRQNNPHGYYECYYTGSLHQRYVREGVATETESVSKCTFDPPNGVAFFNINTYGSTCFSGFEPNINKSIDISINSNGDIVLSNTYKLENNDTVENAKVFFETLYPDSEIYNNGIYRTGVMFSW